jgi:hypothetical protein
MPTCIHILPLDIHIDLLVLRGGGGWRRKMRRSNKEHGEGRERETSDKGATGFSTAFIYIFYYIQKFILSILSEYGVISPCINGVAVLKVVWEV